MTRLLLKTCLPIKYLLIIRQQFEVVFNKMHTHRFHIEDALKNLEKFEFFASVCSSPPRSTFLQKK